MMSNVLLKVICVYFLLTIGTATARNISFSIDKTDEVNTITVTFSEEVDT